MILIVIIVYILITFICFKTVNNIVSGFSIVFKIGITCLSTILTFILFFCIHDFLNFIEIVWLDIIFKCFLIWLIPFVVTSLITLIVKNLFCFGK